MAHCNRMDCSTYLRILLCRRLDPAIGPAELLFRQNGVAWNSSTMGNPSSMRHYQRLYQRGASFDRGGDPDHPCTWIFRGPDPYDLPDAGTQFCEGSLYDFQ